eukprot:11851596-Prorocentrum_lima.AAC.1
MTSSLVGSEMCIRDRKKNMEGAGPINSSVLETAAVGGVAMGLAGIVASVSYTHLTLPTICSV